MNSTHHVLDAHDIIKHKYNIRKLNIITLYIYIIIAQSIFEMLFKILISIKYSKIIES